MPYPDPRRAVTVKLRLLDAPPNGVLRVYLGANVQADASLRMGKVEVQFNAGQPLEANDGPYCFDVPLLVKPIKPRRK